MALFYSTNSRYYNPEIGRFINADGQIGQPGDILGHNMYAYCQNNPVMMVDPNGTNPFAFLAALLAPEIVIPALIIVGVAAVLYSPQGQEVIRDGLQAGADAIKNITSAVSDSIKAIANETETSYSKRFSSGYNVYQLFDENGDVFYVGITRNKKARESAHKKRFGENIKIDYVAENISLSQARVIETGLISHYVMKKHGGILENRSFSISNMRYSTDLLLNKTESDLLLLLGQ